MVRVLDEPGWRPLIETYQRLLPHARTSTAFELMAKLKSGKLLCERWHANSNQCEPVPPEFWQDRQFDATYSDELDICGLDAVPGPGRRYNPQTDFDGREFYVWEPEKVWPTLDTRKAKPRTTRKALGTDSASAAATEAGDTAAVAGKRKRRGKLTAEQIKRGRAHLCAHRELKWKRACPELRRVMKSDVSDNTLWRYFFRKS